MSDKTKVLISTILGACFVLGAIALGISYYKAKQPVQTVSVVGLAQKDFVSDLIVLEFSYSTENMDMKTAYEELKTQTEKVKAYLKEKGIPAKEITFKSIDYRKDITYGYDDKVGRSYQVFNGYVFTQTVRVESMNVDLIETFYQNLGELMEEGVAADSYGPSYYYTKLADLKMQMLAEATKDARQRAETITANAGSTIGSLKVANTGIFQITAPNSNDEDYTWGGAFNTSSKMKRASVNMKLTYYVK
ncbi:MAG: SIMPL domain-containing protein [Bacteroidales bacterium]|nr:SIMPL domain-containing protein [Bacteroidales bacterium]